MIDYKPLLDKYSSEYYLLHSTTITEKEWANKDAALAYLKKYHLPEDEYIEKWKPVQDMIFRNHDKGLAEMMFNKAFSLLAIRGGILFEKEDFEKLQHCARQLGDKKLFVIQNDFGGSIDTIPFRMSYPSDITWEELMSGHFISTAIFEMFANEYFVFSESGKWGKYSANDYELPLDIIGFTTENEALFKKSFELPAEEREEIKEWLPPKYKELI